MSPKALRVTIRNNVDRENKAQSVNVVGDNDTGLTHSVGACFILHCASIDTFLGQRPDRCVQHVYLEEEDIELTFTGYRFLQSRLYIYYLACVLSAGIFFLLGRWLPQRYLAFVAEKCEMSQAESVVVEVNSLFAPSITKAPLLPLPHDPFEFE